MDTDQSKKESLYQSKVFVCVLNNRVDAVDQLLFFVSIGSSFPNNPY